MRSDAGDAAARRPGQIVILNGVPRSGKSSVAHALQNQAPGVWINIGVDSFVRSTPERFRPGIGLRPGGERPDLEPLVVMLYAALFESVATTARTGLNVVVDVGLHDSYSRPLGVISDAAQGLRGLPVLFVGVRCPLEVIWQRRRNTWDHAAESGDDDLVAAVERWQSAVHANTDYDFEVDTSLLSPEQCASAIVGRLAGPPGASFHQFARGSPSADLSAP